MPPPRILELCNQDSMYGRVPLALLLLATTASAVPWWYADMKPPIESPTNQASNPGAQPSNNNNNNKGYGFFFTAQALRQRPDVRSVREDIEVHATQCLNHPAYYRDRWGLDSLDGVANDDQFRIDGDGSGVDVYVLDTGQYDTAWGRGGRTDRQTCEKLRIKTSFSSQGIRRGHIAFDGYHSPSTDRVDSLHFDSYGGDGSDDNYHGTMVAGFVGANIWGVAKEATLIPVKVLNRYGSGYMSDILAGLNWILEQVGPTGRNRPSVINMSLGASNPGPSYFDGPIDALRDMGVLTVVAAGNEGVDACLSDPAKVPSAITVGAVDKYNHLASFSNTGSCLDIFAPGVLGSGTSYSAPLVAGVIAAYISTLSSTPFTAAFANDVEGYILTNAAPLLQGGSPSYTNMLLRTLCT
ncbi:uncharacterized protein LOC106167839 [Lingula anatina]|uniref:Uncharacterized protein LOC106167839 n=1 Tax=Lingula anatina TaxID=7574 RepID=A0A1S3IXA7_LINAN|nr:uncharacterized protein LOC106167839 [Lingula anatina]|eukprot:XP_013402179.1 uncharacterized protein LOC106167839 [Lingula anatina]